MKNWAISQGRRYRNQLSIQSYSPTGQRWSQHDRNQEIVAGRTEGKVWCVRAIEAAGRKVRREVHATTRR